MYRRKLKKEILEKSKIYNSEILRQDLEQEITRREEEEARRSAERLSKELRLSDEEVARLIREDRGR
jgi:citrate lyase beta subunit